MAAPAACPDLQFPGPGTAHPGTQLQFPPAATPPTCPAHLPTPFQHPLDHLLSSFPCFNSPDTRPCSRTSACPRTRCTRPAAALPSRRPRPRIILADLTSLAWAAPGPRRRSGGTEMTTVHLLDPAIDPATDPVGTAATSRAGRGGATAPAAAPHG